MKSSKKEFITIVLLLVVALVGTYVVNADTIPQKPSKSPVLENASDYPGLSQEFGEICTHEGDESFLLAIDYPNSCNSCGGFCSGSKWQDMGFTSEDTCVTACTENCGN